MPKKDYLPDDIPSYNEWINNYELNYPTIGATLGLSAPEITAGTALITAYKTAYAAQIVLNDSTFYCVDSVGFAGKRTTDLSTATVCPAN